MRAARVLAKIGAFRGPPYDKALMAAGDGLNGEPQESVLIRHEENSMIHPPIEGLLRLFREALVLRDMEDMSYHENADITGVPAEARPPEEMLP
jgi:DNA-directed RNA polymerase specialized sigma24 family protein